MADQTENPEFDADKAREFYNTATVDDLKAELGERKLSTSGNKPELVERLVDNDRDRASAEANNDDAEQAPAEQIAQDTSAGRAPSPTANMTPEEKDAHIAYLEDALAEQLRKNAAAAGDGDEEQVPPEDDSEICGLCYPQGWPDPQGARVSRIDCEHGTYDR